MTRDAADPRLPPPASELGRSRGRDRLLLAPVPEYAERRMERHRGPPVPERRLGAVRPGRGAAAHPAAKRDLAFRLACWRLAGDGPQLQDPPRGHDAAALYQR